MTRRSFPLAARRGRAFTNFGPDAIRRADLSVRAKMARDLKAWNEDPWVQRIGRCFAGKEPWRAHV